MALQLQIRDTTMPLKLSKDSANRFLVHYKFTRSRAYKENMQNFQDRTDYRLPFQRRFGYY